MKCSNTVFLLSLSSAGLAANVTFPDVSRSPSKASQILDRRLASFSFEFAYLPNFGGNFSSPNVLTRELMLRLEERTGVGPDIRPGGITMYAGVQIMMIMMLNVCFTPSDSSEFDPSAPALDLDESSVSHPMSVSKQLY